MKATFGYKKNLTDKEPMWNPDDEEAIEIEVNLGEYPLQGAVPQQSDKVEMTPAMREMDRKRKQDVV